MIHHFTIFAHLIFSILCCVLHWSVKYLHAVLQGVKLGQVQGALGGEGVGRAQKETNLYSPPHLACHFITT